MTTPRASRPARMDPAARRAEIIGAAAELARAEGLEAVTLRRVALRLGVASGLVNHYFPAADKLVAEAFGQVVSADLDTTFAAVARQAGAVARLRTLLTCWVAPDTEHVGPLWLDAWSFARTNAPLRAEVNRQMLDGHERVVDLLRGGVAEQVFAPADLDAVAWRLLTLLDGVIVHSTLRVNVVPTDVGRAVAALLEHDLGLPDGSLG
ncbi:hypothetical protein Cs7R123_47490 [Catellatospora sp. TT07R-123]|uniref:TetR family transcriptional regulator C-terminal domain-containing protein n=1 Tax=Catellatospora sp. TT07R-123 TaxID=2733863 RepID=UPI001B2DF7E3|nr:TetR family transcriptional regulator C-terminal domain-containing protein [Catellatospora sp. TT07R-123]GHJ47407.1 hypothetical protein Cs7R123_47490 [Catellatospora sp. TT07R-123]